MKNALFLMYLLCALQCGCAKKTTTEPDVKGNQWAAPSTKPLDPFVQNRKLGRGVNLGNALEAPNEGDWGLMIEPRFFYTIKNAGFQSVRIPVRWSTHAGNAAPYAIHPAFFSRIDEVVAQALNQGLTVVLNIHHYEELIATPAGHKERFLALWRQISSHYKDYPDELFLEILNEPNGALTAEIWNSYLLEAIAVIRETNPYRMLVLGGVDWNSFSSLSKLALPENDRSLIATFHYYLPFQFTHQGAEWVNGSSAWLGTRWTGTQSEFLALKKDLDAAGNWAKANNRPLFMGEFGSYNKADLTSRGLWTATVARQAENRDISWAYWEFCMGFGVYNKDTNEWNATLKKALVP